MFFRKKPLLEEENVAKKGVKKIDTLVTGMILGGIIASIYGVKKLQEKQGENQHATHLIPHEEHHIEHRGDPQRRPSLFARIFLGKK